MENRNGGASSKDVLALVSESSDLFNKNILNPLQSSYLYEESKQNFTYKSAFLIRSPALEEKYNAFRAKRREAGYSEEELKESYGFLLFDDDNKATLLGETGVLTGNSTCTTLGDPSKGVYMSMYSDCLDQNRWYHGKSGYIAIIRVTKGRVKKVFENYTQNFTEPSVGFDCHVSEQLCSVSAQTSSFLAFERTQYYLYELLHDDDTKTAQSPSLACPFAIVSFSYTETKGTFVEPQEIREQKKMDCHFSLWKGQLQVGTQSYHVDLRSTAGAFIPAKLPTVVKVDGAISMTDVRQLLPRAVFESCFFEEVSLDGLYCSLCKLVSSVTEETASFSLLLQELREKDLGLTVRLNDGGFLMLLHSSHFVPYDDAGCTAEEVLQAMFVFPDSRLIQKDTNFGQRKPTISSEVLQIIPALGYAEGEVEKTPPDQTEELCNVLVQHMQSYAALINPGMASSPSREISIFPDQYDVPDAHKDLYTAPRWTNGAWQSFRSYVNKPVSFQLPVSAASEILAAGQQDKTEDHDDDVYIDLSSPENAPRSPVIMETEDQLTGHKSPQSVETFVDICTEAKLDSLVLPQNVVPVDQQPGTAAQDTEKLDFLALTDLIEADKLSVPPTPDDLPAELIVSITSAERTTGANDKGLSVISTISATKDCDIHLSSLPSDDLQKVALMTKPTKKQQRTLRKVQSKGHTKASSLQREDDNSTCWEHDRAQKTSGHSELNKSTNTDWRKLPKCRRKYGKLTPKRKKVRCATRHLTVAEEQKTDPDPEKHGDNTISTDLEPSFLLKKLELWDLKPIFTTCGRVLVPHGSVDVGDEINLSKDEQQSTNYEQCPGNMLIDASVKAHDTVEMKHQSNAAPETTTDYEKFLDGSKHPQNTVVNSENSDLRESYISKSSLTCKSQSDHSSENVTDQLPSGDVQEKQTDNLSPGKIGKKSDFVLSKLSVLLRGKRKILHDISEEISSVQGNEPCLKKGSFDTNVEMSAGDEAIGSALDANGNVEEVAEMLQGDVDFAHSLCLTHTDVPNELQKTEGQDTHLARASSEIQEQAIVDSEPQPMQSSIFQRKCRVKMLKKHQDIPEEDIKKKWWLHFQTSTFSNETDKLKACTGEISARKTLEEQKLSACSSTDALNLLADLALGATKEQVPQQLHPTLEKQPCSSLEICGRTSDIYNAGQESVLHDLLRQPAARPILSIEYSSTNLVTKSDLVELVSKEHGYSLPLSSSLELGVPGTTIRESSLFSSPRLQYHHRKNYSDVVQPASVGLEDGNGHNNGTPESTKKQESGNRKFQHSHASVNKDGSIQVTRQWKGNYDFNLDSKFTNDAKDKTIIRALHGPWDFSIQDSREEVQLIVHMWIGLFYSRSTARFFQVDPNFTYLCSEESECVEMSSRTVPAPAASDQKATSSSPGVIQETSVSKALDMSNKDPSVLNEGPVILDLSMRNANAYIDTSSPQVDGKEPTLSSATLKASVGVNECYRDFVHTTDLRDMNGDTRSTDQDKRTCPSQKIGYLKDSDALSIRGDRTSFPLHKGKKRKLILSENVMSTSGNGHIIHGPNDDGTDIRDLENPGTTAINLVQKPRTESSETIACKGGDSNSEPDNGVHADVENGKQIEQPNQADCHTVLESSFDPTNKESGIVCNEKVLENDNGLSKVETKAESLDQPEKLKDFAIIFEEDTFVSPVDSGSSLSKQQLPTSDCHDPNKMHFMTESDPHTTLDDHPCQADNGKDACGDLQLSMECTNDNASTDTHTISENVLHEADGGKDTYSDLQLSMEGTDDSASTDTHTITEKVLHAPSHKQPIRSEFVNELDAKNSIYSLNEANCKKATLSMSHENTSSLVSSCASVAQSDNSDERESPNLAAEKCVWLSSEDQDPKLIEVEENSSKIVQFQDHFQCGISEKCKDEVALTKGMDAEIYRTEGLEKVGNRVVIPFIGIEAPENDMIYPQDTCLQDKFEEAVQGQQEIPFICETTNNECSLPTDTDSESQLCHENPEELFAKIPALDAHEANLPTFCGVSEPDDRCPTPTIDEKPFEDAPCSDPCGNTSSYSDHEVCKNIHKDPIRSATSMEDAMVLAQKHCQTSTVNSDPNPDPHPDHELRTLKVLRCLRDYLSTSTYIDTFTQKETADMDFSSDQDPNPNNKCITTSLGPSYISANFNKKKLHDVKQGVVSASTREQEHTRSSSLHQVKSHFKDAFKEVLHTKLQLMEVDPSVGQQYYKTTDKSQDPLFEHSCHARSPTECLQTLTQNIEQDGHKRNSRSNLSHEPLSYSQRPILVVKPSKSDERQANIDNNSLPSTFSKKFLESVKTPSNTGSTHVPYSVGNIWQKTEKMLELSENEYLDLESTSPLDYKGNGGADSDFIPGHRTSLKCTVDNSISKRSPSFLEIMSQRCLQHDMTESLVDQETLIFSEQMKLLLKRSKWGSSRNHTDDKSKLSCSSPLTVQISGQEEQRDSSHMDDLPVFRHDKVMLGLSDRKCLSNTTEENETLHTPQLSCQMGNPLKSVDISGVTTEYASIYEDMMNIICAGKVLPSKSKTIQKERNHSLAGPSNPIDFSEQMTTEMHDSFLSSLNSVVKPSCKVKHRFYIFVTSADAFFEETKAQLEAEGHIAVDSSQFFLDENNSSCLLIIVRNEDIAEHICEVPHLLQLKKSPNVLFAGIDEPDDIVKLTYQELFKRGGFMMFERAALESLSLRNMEKLSEILYELSKTGKWKWMLHYRHSRQLKENARVSSEAKEKKHFFQWCQEAGILEVLPYHECDLASRERPDYLSCLVRLQIQNISSRFTVFITDTITDDTFARNGILTMTVNSLLTVSPSEIFSL